jgi:hypothetical protein
MRAHTLLLAAVMVLAGCSDSGQGRPPPTDRFYFPSGIAFARPAGSTNGVLYVASANLDKRYDNGTLLAVDLDKVGANGEGLPPFGEPVGKDGPKILEALNVPDGGKALLASFAGQMAAYPMGDTLRLFVPSRAEGDKLQVVDATGTQLACQYPAGPGTPLDCITNAPTTTANAIPGEVGKPAAPQPYGVALSQDGQVFVTSLQLADSPNGSRENLEAFALKTSAEDPKITDDSFFSLGPAVADSVAVGSRYGYYAGRYLATSDVSPDVVLRLVDRTSNAVIYPLVARRYHVIEARGLALSRDEKRLYLLGLGPDSLLRVDLANVTSSSPSLTTVRAVPLPSGPLSIKLIERPGHGELAVITCLTAGTVVLYDEELGAIVREIPGVGVEPTGIAVDQQGSGARVFVSDFGDGRVTVIDIPDLLKPQEAWVSAYLGKPQTCLVRDTDPSCQGVNP